MKSFHFWEEGCGVEEERLWRFQGREGSGAKVNLVEKMKSLYECEYIMCVNGGS